MVTLTPGFLSYRQIKKTKTIINPEFLTDRANPGKSSGRDQNWKNSLLAGVAGNYRRWWKFVRSSAPVLAAHLLRLHRRGALRVAVVTQL